MVIRAVVPRSLIGVALGLACIGVALSFAPVAPAAQSSAASRLLSTAFKDAAALGSVRQTITNQAGARHATFSNDISDYGGTEHITVSGGISAVILVTRKAAYLSGNRTALVKYFGFPARALPTIGARWVRISASDAVYPAVADQATLPSVLSGLTPAGPLTEAGTSKIDGQPVIAVRGALPKSFQYTGTMTVYVTRSAHPLPVEVRFVDGKASTLATSTSVLTHWGEHVVVRPPVRTIPIGKV